ncbi:adenylate kinase [Alphaproteobacteria bacterium]|nr:adenylate kinase [Alphaproteobacteria bacterium]
MSVSGKWIVFLGAPGCGKGTQASFLKDDHSFIVVAVGDLLRANADKTMPDSSKTIGEVMKAGELLPNEVTVELVKQELMKSVDIASRNVLFDGFPRTVTQADLLNDLAADFGKNLDAVLYFNIDFELVKKRILGRYTCAKCGMIYNKHFVNPKVDGECDVCGGHEFECRMDDNEVSLLKRLNVYDNMTKPLIDYFNQRGILLDIDAGSPVEVVMQSILLSIGL